MKPFSPAVALLAYLLAIVCNVRALAGEPWSFILPEQRCTQIRTPAQLCNAPIPSIPRPPTITDPQTELPERLFSLSDAINTGLANLEVVRVLGGITANSTGRTVYDVAIANTRIDQQRAVFDPTFQTSSTWSQSESPNAFFNPADPTQALISGGTNEGYGFNTGLSKRTVTGGVIDFRVNSNDTRVRPGTFPLNPQTRSSTDLSFTQPLLQGGGVAVNTIPIVLARIDTERSYFQFKDSIQAHVQSVIAGYWALVFARTQLWAREQQVQQLEFANARTQARFEVGDANKGEAAQTLVAYENFRASLIAARADVLQREAALRNVLGLPPYEPTRIVPTSSLIDEKLEVNWESVLNLAGTQRPDIIELKLILEADYQRLILAKNQALPRLDGVALYRWNGLEGIMPNGLDTGSAGGQFADWNLGINFSVPLGLRRDRALLRQQELLIRRDRANLEQGMHQAAHNLALNLRNLEQFYEQYRRYQAVRDAAQFNLDQQIQAYNVGNIQFIVVLQAIVDWGNAVGNEASSLVQYNTELANLERESGTILETHGVAFYEERNGSIGPLGRFADYVCYPAATRPTAAAERYGSGTEASEEFFDLQDPLRGNEELPRNRIPDGLDSPRDVELEQLREDAPPEADEPEGVEQSRGLLRSGPVKVAEAIKGLFGK